MIFSHHEKGIPTGDIDAAQHLSDATADVPEYFKKTWGEFRLDMTHPWEASDLNLLKAVVAAKCHTDDILAEKLRENCVVRKSKHGDELSADAHAVALALSVNADARMHDYVKPGLPASQYDYPGFFEENRQNIDPAQMPAEMPRASEEAEPEDWQDQNPDAPVVTTKFIACLVVAARAVHGEANSMLNLVTSESEMGVPVPASLAGTQQVIEEYMEGAATLLDGIEADMDEYLGAPEIPESVRGTIYDRAVKGYCMMAMAYAGTVAPAIFGSDFMPDR